MKSDVLAEKSYTTMSRQGCTIYGAEKSISTSAQPGTAGATRKGPGSRLLFRSRAGTPLRPGNVIKRVLNPVLTRLGIALGGRVNHAFRHGRVTVLRKRGIPQDLQQLWIGHTSTEMTDRYSHTDQELDYRRVYAAQAGMKTRKVQ